MGNVSELSGSVRVGDGEYARVVWVWEGRGMGSVPELSGSGRVGGWVVCQSCLGLAGYGDWEYANRVVVGLPG